LHPRVTFLLSIIKTIGGPGSLGFFVVTTLAGLLVARRWPAARRTVAAGLGLLVTAYLALATPAAASALINALPLVPEPEPARLRSVRALVVFDGDNLAGRRRQAQRILRIAPLDDVYLLGADYLLADLRVAMGPGTSLHHDTTTWNTSAQVMRVRDIAERVPPGSTAVVASRVQMPRIAGLLRATETEALLVPSDLDREPDARGLRALLPSYAALLASRDAIYEHAALAWYGWRGDLQ
jgi:hypothetical protein